jgi:Flp pilus assembly protein TadG
MGFKTWMSGVDRSVRAFGRRMADDARGNVAMIFALSLPVLVLMTLGGVDIHRASTVRVNLQDALDAAALAAARSPYVDNENIQRVGMAALRANLQAYPEVTLREADTSFTLVDEERVIARGMVDVKTLVANIFLPPYGTLLDKTLPVGAKSEVTRASKNIEVALVLDVTGSMDQSGRMTALKEAATSLITLVVQPLDQQQPYYSKVAIVPYSIGVNAGDAYANAVRGSLHGPTPISGARWAASAATSITKVERTNPARITSANHGLTTGSYVWIAGTANVPSNFNSKIYRVTAVDTNRFTLDGYNNNVGASLDGSGGTVRKCILADCTVVVTSNAHGLVDDEFAYVSGVGGMTALNNSSSTTGSTSSWQIDLIDADRFRVNLLGPTQPAYTSNGTVQCGRDRCAIRSFRRADNTLERIAASTCVTDRAGGDALSDASPRNGSWLGRLYPASDRCSPRPVTPLSDRRDDLVAEIGRLQPEGSTAGQIGFAWGWYMLSENFNSVWPSASRAAPNDPEKTLKAIILMTDGEFNTTYCDGVLANNAGYSDNANQINCNANNGNPFAQTAALCDEVKKARKIGDGRPAIIIYTVGLSVSTSRGGAGIDTAREVLEHCATTPDRAKFATTSAQLSSAFEEFARDLTRLRIAK